MPNKDTAKTALAPSRFKQFAQYLFLLVFFIACGVVIYFFTIANDPNYRNVTIKNESFKLEVVNKSEGLAKGLSGKNALSQNSGMLFDFGALGTWQMWMKNMNFAIDILWLDENGKIVGIETNVLPSTYPKTFGTLASSWYVIELPAGTVNNLSLKFGDVVSLN